jgi:hypothetical protein
MPDRRLILALVGLASALPLEGCTVWIPLAATGDRWMTSPGNHHEQNLDVSLDPSAALVQLATSPPSCNLLGRVTGVSRAEGDQEPPDAATFSGAAADRAMTSFRNVSARGGADTAIVDATAITASPASATIMSLGERTDAGARAAERQTKGVSAFGRGRHGRRSL